MKMKKKSILRRLIPWIIALAAIAALIVWVFIPIYSQKENTYSEEPVIHSYEGDSKKLIMESDRLRFEMDPATTQFSVQDKLTQKTWYSNPPDYESDSIVLASKKSYLASTLYLTYVNENNEMDNYSNSIENQNYTITQGDDGAIRIDYAIGKIERTYLFPVVISSERYADFTGKMSKATKKKVGAFYTTSTIGETSVYMMKTDAKTNTAKNKQSLEKYFEEAGYTWEDYETDMALLNEERNNNGPVFNVSMIYRLDGDDLVVEIPYDSIRCGAETPVTYITVLPMFGAAGDKQEGFMLIPEGGGAIINNNNGKLNQTAYSANLYGWDYADERLEAPSETENAFPVFGMSQPDGSFICIIEGGSAYAAIKADIAGPGHSNSYNCVYSKYNVLHYDEFKVQKSGTPVYMYESKIPNDSVVHRYRFVEGSSYVAMAEAYGDYLRSQPDMKTDVASAEMPVNVELVGAINKVLIRAGFPVDSVVPVTTFSEASDIIRELTESGVKDLHARMTGWSNGGVRQKVLTGVNVVRQLGGNNGMKKLIEDATKLNTQLFFDGINCFAYKSGILQGFFGFSNAARFTTREQVRLYSYDIVTYQQSTWADSFYLVRPEYAKANATHLIDALKNRGAAGVAFRDIGNLLSADYYVKNTVSREQVKQMNVGSLKEAVDKGLKISIKEGNDYAVPYVDLITDMNLTGNSYAIIDERIPFYQIALHGLKNYTGEPINLAGDYVTALLECAEYGAGLSFSVMKADTTILQDTAYSCYTSGGYDLWKDQIIAMVNRYQKEMSGLNQRRIVGHERLATDVTVTVYDNGAKVYVNYGAAAFDANGVHVPARDYVVEGGSAT